MPNMRRQTSRGASAVSARLFTVLLLGSAASWLTGCASTTEPEVVSRIPVSEQRYVIDPLTGYPLTVDAETKARVREGYAGFAAGRPLTEIATLAESLATQDPALLPAGVLRAQVEFLSGSDRAAVERLQPILDELPDYLAASLLAARALERMGAILKSYEVFAALASWNDVARERADALYPRAVEIVHRRFADALDRGHAEEAATHLDRLAEWSVPETELLPLQRRFYFETAQGEQELDVIRRWLESGGPESESPGSDDPEPDGPTRDELLLRLGDLELEVGDLRAGMELFERLAGERPDDLVLADRVAKARFLWRLELLPPKVQEISRAQELDRADLASLLYWLFPRVRFSEVEEPPIAADILDHEQREEILRVLDLGLMAVDETVHRFHPDQEATREILLAALLGLLQGGDPPAACLANEPRLPLNRRSQRWICDTATRCGLIADATECLPAAVPAGVEAVDLVRRALQRPGGEAPGSG